MIDNLNKIEPLLSFNSEFDFYFIQIIKRKKDHPEMKRHLTVIKRYYIYSLEELHSKKEEMISYCQMHAARAYINLNVRNSYKVGLNTLCLVSDMLLQRNYKGIQKAWASACGSNHSEKDKKWIVDIDIDHQYKTHTILEYLKEYAVVYIPSKTGWHLITRPFNSLLFNEKFGGIDIQKDGPTILFSA